MRMGPQYNSADDHCSYCGDYSPFTIFPICKEEFSLRGRVPLSGPTSSIMVVAKMRNRQRPWPPHWQRAARLLLRKSQRSQTGRRFTATWERRSSSEQTSRVEVRENCCLPYWLAAVQTIFCKRKSIDIIFFFNKYILFCNSCVCFKVIKIRNRYR